MLSVEYQAQKDLYRVIVKSQRTNGKTNLKATEVMTFSRVNTGGKDEKVCMSFLDLGSFTQGMFSLQTSRELHTPYLHLLLLICLDDQCIVWCCYVNIYYVPMKSA